MREPTSQDKGDVTEEAPEAAAEQVSVPETEVKPVPGPERKKRPTHHIIGFWTLAFLLALVIFAALAVLAVTGREITFPEAITSRIERKINSELNGPEVSIGEIIAIVDSHFVPRVTARNVGLIDGTGAEIARLNELRAVLSKEALKARQLRPDTLRLSGAQITVRRSQDGAFALDFGGTQRVTGSGVEVLEAIDRAFSTDPLSGISRIEARELTVSLEDARSGRIWQATDAGVTLVNTDQDIDIKMNFEIFNGTEDLAKIELGFGSNKGSLASSISLNMDNAPARDFALQSPTLSFLSVVDAPISAAMRAEIGPDGQLAQYTGSLEIEAGQIVAAEGAEPLDFEGAKGYFDYDPVGKRILFPELRLETDALDITSQGQVLLRDFEGSWPQSFTGQWRISELRVAPEGLFPEPLVFDQALITAKLRLDPFVLDFGQIDLAQGDLWLRGKGRAEAGPEGWSAALDLSVDEMTQAELIALWPPAAVAKTRSWMAENIFDATYRDLDLALRFAPGQSQPTLAMDWDFDALDMRYMAALPPVSDGHGYGALFGSAMTITMNGGTIEAPSGGPVEVAGTVLRIPDIFVKPARLEIGLKTQSSVEAGLALVAGPPFNALRESTFGPDVAEGQAALSGQIGFPLIKKVMFEDVNFLLNGTLTEVSTDQLMPGQVLSADRLALTMDPSGLSIAGAARIGTAQMSGQWRKNFGPDHKGRSDMVGQARINQALLDTFNIALPKGMIAGETEGALSVALRKGQPPAFEVTSDLSGLRLSFAPVGYGKPAGTRGQLVLKGTAGPQPEITTFELSGAGLSARDGRVEIAPGGQFERLSFGRVTLGDWFDAPLSIVGQGAGKPVKVEITGGRLNLARATFGGSGGGGTTGPVPIEVQLDRLTLSEGLALHGFSARLSSGAGVTGSFSGRLNGTGALTGTIRPGVHGPTITATSQDAGAVVSATGVLERASGGVLNLGLTALPEEGSFDGRVTIDDIRVQSAPSLAELLSAISVVGLIEQMTGGGGILFTHAQSDFILRPGRLTVKGATAEGPSLGITIEGLYDTAAKTVDMQGVVSPIYFVNALGQIVSRKGEGLFGFTYTLTGAAKSPSVGVNPLSLLTPGALRNIFRKAPAGDQ
ncbi:AsmA-like C-terminal region-containing protein [Celeribacter sp.]|uniref:YhdP family protein n=1 Tax=Celeribacter sp. TaxID=1890673 RepID=UPI003A916900